MASAAKEFRFLPSDIKHRMSMTIEKLHREPRPRGVRKLQGHAGLYRVRVGSYRLIYEIDDLGQLIVVTQVRHRREAYR
ncbi:MAG: type II toxin-antitoxin system RelE/ParE family toxin [Deltaproteobacteria bacterium]|nr:type II toxin-antitoxin system RelE/ParE family toxin [Deltaproteobacteria bacterium]